MKKFTLLFLALIFGAVVFAQQYSYEIEMKNFTQVNETQFQWDIYLRKGETSNDFALYTMQTRLSFNTQLLNTGAFQNGNFTIDASGTELYQESSWFNSAHVTIVQSGTQINWAVTANPAGGANVTVIDRTWRKVATFKAQLRKNGNAHNFADVDPQFAFEIGGANTIVVRSDSYTGSNPTAKTSATSTVVPAAGRVLIPALGVKVNSRELAGYWFYKTNTYQIASHWNQILKAATPAYIQVVPGAANNAVIVGAATVTDARTVKALTVAKGGYLVLNQDAQLTTDKLYNDNQNGAKMGEKTDETVIASWDFEGAGTTLPYFADDGLTSNSGLASFNTTATFDDFYTESGSTKAPYGYNFRIGGGAGTAKDWRILISTSGYQNLKISSKQWSDIDGSWGGMGNGPDGFTIQWSADGSTWTDVPGSSVSVSGNWTTGVISNLTLPSDLNNLSMVYIRWRTNAADKTKNGYTSIDDILITGEPLPTGILLESTALGTGSLIHNSDGVEATIKRHIAANHVEPLHHLVSVPIAQSANPVSNLFLWSYLYFFDAETHDWVNLGAPTNTPLDVSRGYMIMKFPGLTDWDMDTTYSFPGPMNNGTFTMNVFDQNGDPNGHLNLVPNPYPSAIDWDAVNGWIKTNINASIWIWNPVEDTYAAYVTGIGGTNGCSNFIPIGQSFFIKSTAHSPVLTVNNVARVHNDQFFFKDTKDISNVLRIKAIANDYSDETLISFKAEATTGYDGQFDAGKLFSDKKAPQIYTVATDQEELCINALPYSPEVIVIPMGFKLKESGLCTFIASSIESFDPSVTIFLEDCIAGTMTDLRKQPEYSFTHTAGNDPLRFKLIFNGTTSIEESEASNVQLYFNDKTLYLNFSEDKAEKVHICIYSTNGQLVFDTYGQTVNSEIHVPNLTRGVYVVRLITDSKSIIKKVMSN